MSLSLLSYVCITNNPDLEKIVSNVDILNGSALAVLTLGRTLIHSGWIIVANPLYGNFKPNQQPYRTVIFKKKRGTDVVVTDIESLNLIENAIAFYLNTSLLILPGELPQQVDIDYRYLDFKLMEETFLQCGLLLSVLERFTGGDSPNQKYIKQQLVLT